MHHVQISLTGHTISHSQAMTAWETMHTSHQSGRNQSYILSAYFLWNGARKEGKQNAISVVKIKGEQQIPTSGFSIYQTQHMPIIIAGSQNKLNGTDGYGICLYQKFVTYDSINKFRRAYGWQQSWVMLIKKTSQNITKHFLDEEKTLYWVFSIPLTWIIIMDYWGLALWHSTINL